MAGVDFRSTEKVNEDIGAVVEVELEVFAGWRIERCGKVLNCFKGLLCDLVRTGVRVDK